MLTNLLKKLLIVASIAAATIASADELTAAKRAQIKTLLELTGIKGLPEQIATNTVQSWVPGIKQLDPKFPDKGFMITRDAFVSALSAKTDAPGGLIEQVTLVYHNAFTAPEIAELLKFYQSATGKKLLAAQTKLNGETFQTAMKWADSLSGDIDRSIDTALKKEGLKLPEAPKDAPKAAPSAPAPSGAAQPPAKK